jgi:Protein of unknown function (DUF3617)
VPETYRRTVTVSSYYSYRQDNNEIIFSRWRLATGTKAFSEENAPWETYVSGKNFGKKFARVVGATIFAAIISAAHAETLQPGHWKVVTTPIVNGNPVPPQTKVRCVTPEEAADVAKMFSPQAATANSECAPAEHELTPTSLKWRLQCRGQMTMDVVGAFAFDTPQHYSAEVLTKGSIGGQTIESRVKIDAERVGDCP